MSRGRVVRTRRAREDLLDIWEDIAADQVSAADGVLDAIEASCQRLATHPKLGAARDDIRPGLRHLVVSPYLILYRLIDGGVEIVRVVHGRRDLSHLE